MAPLFLFMADPFEQNIQGVTQLIQSGINKTEGGAEVQDGVTGEYVDVLELPMPDGELLDLSKNWENKYVAYYPSVRVRQEKNKLYYRGTQHANQGDNTKTVSSNMIFEAQENFLPQALSKNPEPVVWSDDTPEGKQESNDLKTMLQFHADILCLRKKLGVQLRQWSVYFIGVIKHGWDAKLGEIKLDLRNPKNLLLDPDGYVDEYGNFVGSFLGERIESTAQVLIDLYPKKADFIKLKVDGKLGTLVTRTEWWTDDYCFTTFSEEVLDKHKNEFYNYEEGLPNHFAAPKMPYTFLSIFSMQEAPHDITNLIEQNIPNQDRINDRDYQISKNLRVSNNSLAVSDLAFTSETAKQAANALEDGDPILVSGEIDKGIMRFPAPSVPDAVFKAQENDIVNLRTIFGTQGLTATPQKEDQTVRGLILNQSHDSTRIGGGVGDALEQVADNVFNWWVQLYCVFYDEKHYASIMGNGRAVSYVALSRENLNRKFVVSVSPDSMKPRDEVSEMNLAIERWNNKAIDPISLMKQLNESDPMESAKKLVLWTTNPQLYAQTYFPEMAQQAPPNPEGPPATTPGTPPPTLGAPPANAALNQVPLPQIPK